MADDGKEAEDLKIEMVRPPFTEEQVKEITRFFYSLDTEQQHFHLGLEHILRSSLLAMLWDTESKHVVGLGGYRSNFGILMFFLVVNRQYQGRGFGKKLAKQVVAEVPANRVLMLTVERSNLHARMLYKAAGFETLNRHKAMATMLYKNALGKTLKIPLRILVHIRNYFSSDLSK